MDPIGFGLESYDAVGARRDKLTIALGRGLETYVDKAQPALAK